MLTIIDLKYGKLNGKIIEQFAGCGRNVQELRKYFNDNDIYINDSSLNMIKYAIEHYKVEKSHTYNKTVQEFDWSSFKN